MRIRRGSVNGGGVFDAKTIALFLLNKEKKMYDQCEHCTLKGNLEKCESVYCPNHGSWYTSQIKSQLDVVKKELSKIKIATAAIKEYCAIIDVELSSKPQTLNYDTKTTADGNTKYYLNDQLHRTDGPAIEGADGTKLWYQNGKLHRTDGPAIEYANGGKEWYQNGKLHRTDGPAVEWADGGKEWYLNGKLHRTDGPAVEWADGTKEWYLNGKLQKDNA